MVLDINKFRTENGGNPEEIKKSELKRKGDPNVVDDVIKFDQEWRKRKMQLTNSILITIKTNLMPRTSRQRSKRFRKPWGIRKRKIRPILVMKKRLKSKP